MTDEPTTPDREPTPAPQAPEPAGPARTTEAAGASTAVPDREQTGIIDLHDTRAIPSPPAAPPSPAAPAAPAAAPEPTASTGPRRDDGGDDAWFDVFGGEHPGEGAGVPARADSSWGSDRADARAEESYRSSYAPPANDHGSSRPVAGPAPDSGTPDGAAAAAGASPGAGATAYESTSPQGRPDGSPVAGPAPGGVLLTDERPAPARRRRGRLVAAVAGLCLLSGVVGGVAGQLAEDRINTGTSTLPEPGPGATARPPGSVANIAAVALPSVVTIKVDGGSEGSATGSGFVIDNKGHVLTNNHVVATAPSGDIQVVLSNGDAQKATIVGRDTSYDLAVLKIARTDLTPLQLGPSDKVVVGDQVIAVGAPLGLDQTVTTGIVSALNRPVSAGEGPESSFINAIQTDTAINPGNSGGPLLDMSGEVIGINSAIARVPGTSGSAGGSIGLGFAIPSDQARRTADQLIATGKATHPIIGVSLDRTFSGDGAQVSDQPGAVTAGGPAAKAGVKPGDVVVGFEGKRIRTPDQLIVSIRARAVGDTVKLKVERGGKEIELSMTLEADPGK
ncbi:MAG: S1C family serine protease [Terrabacter sp.]